MMAAIVAELHCPGCEVALRVLWRIDERRALWECPQCGLAMLRPPASEDPSAIYTRGYYESGYLSRVDVCEKFFGDQLAELERDVPKGRLLDVGCGIGYFLAVAARRGWSATGIDPSASAIEEARRRTQGLPNVTVIQGSLERTTRFSEAFDLVTFWDSIAHVSDVRANLRAASDALKMGGTLAIKTALRPPRTLRWAVMFAGIKKSWTEAALHLATQWNQMTPRTLEMWAPRFGLKMIRSYKVSDPGEKSGLWSGPFSRARVAQHVIEGIGQRLAGSASFIAILRKVGP